MKIMVLYPFVFLSLVAAAPTVHDVRNYGAKGDGAAKDTAAIQSAIDAAARGGGGVVVFPPGNYVAGTVHLRSNITLELSAGARLTASPDQADFAKFEQLPFRPADDEETTYFRFALLTGESLQNVSIRGPGIIDGNRSRRGGPKPVALKNSEHVSIRNVTIRNAPNYAVSLLGCADVDVDGVVVLNGYSDGIDPDCSRFVRISNCYVDSADDAICLKSSQALGRPMPTEQVTVTNCVLRTNANHFKLGTESRGGFRDIVMNNCVMLRRDTGRAPVSGISIETVDGAEVDGIAISNVSMRGAGTPLFLRLGNRGRGLTPPAPGSLRGVTISNVIAVGGTVASSITGLENSPARDINLSDISLTMAGGGAFQGIDVPEHAEKYPEATMFGPLPAYGLYARHVEGLTLRNVAVRWEQPDQRPALVFDDVKNLDVSGFRFDSSAGPQPVIWFHRVLGAIVSGCRVPREIALLVRVSGAEAKDIAILNSDLRHAKRLIDVALGAGHGAIALTGNLTPGKIPGID